jgi:hypothetical protein
MRRHSGCRAAETGHYADMRDICQSIISPWNAMPFSVDELTAKMINAVGGEANLRKHKSLVMNATFDYEQQGMTGEAAIHARAPNSWSESVTFFALGKKLGTTHDYFDGANGGAETSFLPPRIFSGDTLQNMKIVFDFYPLLNQKTLFKSVTIKGISKVNGEDAYVIVKTPEKGTPVTDYVSTKSFLVLRSGSETPNAITESYSDYRTVDGALMPFKIERNVPGIGNIVISVKEVKFDSAIPESIFRGGLLSKISAVGQNQLIK